jgi:mono/diheme cytochrome c family protein
LVRARAADGSASLAITCATCHAAPARRPGDAIEDGLPNAALDIGAMITDSPGTSRASAASTWGPGRLDVTTTLGTEPVRIPDLRPVRGLTHLHHDATLAVQGRATLSIRIETLIITSYGQVVRPPRIVARALAAYVSALADRLPVLDAAVEASPRGAQLFSMQCASCHAPPNLTGAPVPLAVVGTDPTLGSSAERGTGSYRVPSLRGVGSRGPLLHDGTVPSIDALLDPARPTPDFVGRLHGAGAVPGHTFGLSLDAADRAALTVFLKAL